MKKILVAIHGFGSSKSSSKIAALVPGLKERGVEVVAFDLPGHGENKTPLRIKNCLELIKKVEDDIRAKNKDAEIYIYGSSFGAYLTLLHLIDNKREYGEVFLRVPAIDCYKCFTDAKAKEYIKGLDPAFINDLKENDVLSQAHKIKEKLNIIYGTDDKVVDNSEIYELAKKADCKIYPIEGADHQFKNPKHLEKFVEIVLYCM